MTICFITAGCQQVNNQQEKTITSIQINSLFQNHGLRLSEPTESISENVFLKSLNDVTPETYTIDERQFISVYVYSSTEERIKGYMDFEDKVPASGEIWHRSYQVANVIFFYIPTKLPPQFEQFDLIIVDIRSLAK